MKTNHCLGACLLFWHILAKDRDWPSVALWEVSKVFQCDGALKKSTTSISLSSSGFVKVVTIVWYACHPLSVSRACSGHRSWAGICVCYVSRLCLQTARKLIWQIYMGAWIWRRMFLGKIFYFIEDTEGFTCCVQGMVLGWWKYGNVVCKTAAKKSQCGRGTALGNSLTRCRHSAETVGGRGKPFTTCNSWLALEKATAILPTSNRLPLGVSSLAHPQQPRIMKGKKCWREQV